MKGSQRGLYSIPAGLATAMAWVRRPLAAVGGLGHGMA